MCATSSTAELTDVCGPAQNSLGKTPATHLQVVMYVKNSLEQAAFAGKRGSLILLLGNAPVVDMVQRMLADCHNVQASVENYDDERVRPKAAVSAASVVLLVRDIFAIDMVYLCMVQVTAIFQQWHIKWSHQRTFAFSLGLDAAVQRDAALLNGENSFLVTPIVWEIAVSSLPIMTGAASGLDPNNMSWLMPSTGRWAVAKKRSRNGEMTQHNVYNVITHARHYDVSSISKSVRACIDGLGTPLLHVVDPTQRSSAEVRSEEPEAGPDDATDVAYVPGGVVGSNPADRPANTRRTSQRQRDSEVTYMHAYSHACMHTHIHGLMAGSVLGTL